MGENTINVSDSSFEKEVLEAEELVLVDFWADWCGPCKALTPIIEEVAASEWYQIQTGNESKTLYAQNNINPTEAPRVLNSISSLLDVSLKSTAFCFLLNFQWVELVV